MTQHLPAIIIVVPLLSALLVAVFGWIKKTICFVIALPAMGIVFLSSIVLFYKVITENQPIIYFLGGWSPPVGIAYNIDHLSSLVLVLISGVTLAHLIATRQTVIEEFTNKVSAFYTLYILFVTGLMGIVATGDAFNLYVLLEIASITGYAMIGMNSGRAYLACFNYIIIGTIGACLYLLGVGYIYLVTGSLNMLDIASILPGLVDSKVVPAAFIICMVGLMVKMGLFPLHGWLPNAYTYAPSSVSTLMAPLTTKVMIYVMVRVALYVFTPVLSFSVIKPGNGFTWIAVAAIIMGSLMALSQQNIKKMLSYIVIAEVGYMVGGLWLGNRMGITGAILHIVNDAVMTLCIFLAVVSFSSYKKRDKLSDFQGAFKEMPVTAAVFCVAAISIIGVPPTCGFFSKWYLISGGLAAGHYAFVAALLFSSLINMVLFFRIIEIAYFEPFSDHHGKKHHVKIAEASPGLLIPLIIVACMLIILGLYTDELVTHVISHAIPAEIV
ncbi:MAG: monovalent cation/H+ antiporter subunit D family protein [Desulfobacterales bacterium]|nr:monovalent cation/H+ antiporter subunit D family protein [Desulfobacterales bacterium]